MDGSIKTTVTNKDGGANIFGIDNGNTGALLNLSFYFNY